MKITETKVARHTLVLMPALMSKMVSCWDVIRKDPCGQFGTKTC